MRRAVALAVASVTLGGCMVGPDYQRPPITSPANFRDQAPTEDTRSLADLPWWQLFQDPVLVQLVGEAVQNNRDLRGAVARVAQARALARIQKAQILPALSANAGASYGRGNLTFPTENPTTGAVFEVDAQLNWEIDIWGRIRRGSEAAVAEYLATEQGRRAATVSLVADVAIAYVELRQLDTQLDISLRTVKNYQRTLQLFEDQLQGGAATKLPVTTGRAQLDEAEAVAKDVERLVVRQENLLSLLLGRPPGPIARGPDDVFRRGPTDIPAGLPSTLLERRPDVLSAEHRLVAANARIGVAKADFFPRFSLTALAGLATPDLTNLFKGSSVVWGVGGNVSWLAPILQGDALRGQSEAASAQWEETKNVYEQTVLTAFREVADALADLRRLDGIVQHREAQVASLTESLSLANDRFYGGVSIYLEVTTTQNLLFPAELNLASVRAQRTDALINLYRALGGGWQLPESQPPPPGSEPAQPQPPAPTPR